jgi:acyl-CoA synthetase (AMP-forming)/AMP-acid ligase II
VALQAPNGPAFLAGLLALRRTGSPALLLDPRTPPRERRRLARELGARRALVCSTGWPAGVGEWTVEAVEDAAAVTPPADSAVIKLSSGSTGSARGVATPTAALLADDDALVRSMGILPADRLLAAIPLSHSYGLSSLAVPALVRGLPLVLPSSEGPFGPLAAASEAAATVLPTVPAWLGAAARLASPPPLPPALRLVLSAGAPLPAETSARFRERFGRPVHVFYGASECGGICYDREGSAAERGTVGSPVEGVTLDLLPPDDGGGEDAGRVAVRSPAVAIGYLPTADDRLAGGRFATDDLARWRGGELALVGRLNDLINVKGRKVNPREVERVLAALPAVEDVVVTGVTAARPDAGGEETVRAVIACRPGALSPAEVVTWCRDHLAEHKVPRSVVLVDALPRTERGKVDREGLAAVAGRERLEGAPGA